MMKKYFIQLLSLYLLFSCTQEDNGLYVGPPKDLRYAGVADYECGDYYTTYQPSVFTGGEEATFGLTSVTSQSGENIALENNFSISSQTGIITFLEYNNLLPGNYTFDVNVKNSMGEVNFPNVLSFTAHQAAPKNMIYVPHIYSVFGNELDFNSEIPRTKGGGPYTFSLHNHKDIFSIDEALGTVQLSQEYTIGDEETEVFSLDISIQNAKGDLLKEEAMFIELLGKNVGKLLFHGISFQGTEDSYGLENMVTEPHYGSVTKELLGQEYTTEITEEVSGPVFASNMWRRAWAGIPFQVRNENGVINDDIFIGYWSWEEESRNFLITDTIDLTDFEKSAYVSTTGMWRYNGGAMNDNQHLMVAVIAADELDLASPTTSNWEILDNDISDRFYQYPSGIIEEAELKANGTVQVDIPAAYLGKKIKVALVADFLNPEIGSLSRRFYVHQLQVRAQ
ncbi:hypothetical protein MY04_5396 [Flammeovirga sp. MY04]|uniref:hypothetical protein n=1 Tax=Flammeovirga sp. MY04 TaxID=1191459 RepID=UPI0008064204|nr:hypothetical protein [Flammeovirga sp. MY04]ANQ52728.1 hypothetical protein MY04_5396 [Flammeovirga sp. MY04]